MSAKYTCVVADPPWQFGDKLPGKSRGAEKNYAVMSVPQIRGMYRGPVDAPSLALCGKKFRLADDALLFLWRVASMPREALDVIDAWGFEPKSEIVWIKTTGGKSAGSPQDLEPPFVQGSDTSEAAAESVAGSVEAVRALVFECICAAGDRGRTCDAIEKRLQMLHQTTSARVRDLALMGRIIDSGQRRKTRSGRLAVVWVKAPPGSGRQPAARVSHAGQKLHFGMGRYVRNCHETCTIAARGRATQLIENHSTRSVFFAPVPRDEKGRITHSAKPPEFYRIVEELCGGRRLELFARERREGWTCAGNEIGVVKTARNGG